MNMNCLVTWLTFCPDLRLLPALNPSLVLITSNLSIFPPLYLLIIPLDHWLRPSLLWTEIPFMISIIFFKILWIRLHNTNISVLIYSEEQSVIIIRNPYPRNGQVTANKKGHSMDGYYKCLHYLYLPSPLGVLIISIINGRNRFSLVKLIACELGQEIL